jgi:DNA helicase-2/ATP-dependent DNA helicase PcrA
MTRAMEKLTLTHAMARALYGRRDYNLASRFLDELPPNVERERLRPSSWSSYGSERQTGLGGQSGASSAQTRAQSEIPDLQTGDSVRHGSLGEGVVTRIEAGGLVTVRFAKDQSERKLMLEYAPLEKIG